MRDVMVPRRQPHFTSSCTHSARIDNANDDARKRDAGATKYRRPRGVVRLPFVGVDGFLLHHLQDAFACVCTVIRIAINGDGLLQWTDIVLAMNVDTGTALLCDLAYGAALSADYGADHVALHQQPQWEIGLAAGTATAGWQRTILAAAIPLNTLLFVHRFGVQFAALEFDAIQATSSPSRERERGGRRSKRKWLIKMKKFCVYVRILCNIDGEKNYIYIYHINGWC